MKAIEFPGVNVRIAEKQEEYETLPAYVDQSQKSTPVLMCFKLDEDEMEQVKESGQIWLTILTFGGPLQPIGMKCLKPEFTQETIEEGE